MLINYRVEEKRGEYRRVRLCKGANTCGPTRSVFFERERERERERGPWVSYGVCESVYGGGTTGIWQLLSRLVLRPCARRSTHPLRLLRWYSEPPPPPPRLCWNSRRFESVLWSSIFEVDCFCGEWWSRGGEFSRGWIVRFELFGIELLDVENYRIRWKIYSDGKFNRKTFQAKYSFVAF